MRPTTERIKDVLDRAMDEYRGKWVGNSDVIQVSARDHATIVACLRVALDAPEQCREIVPRFTMTEGD